MVKEPYKGRVLALRDNHNIHDQLIISEGEILYIKESNYYESVSGWAYKFKGKPGEWLVSMDIDEKPFFKPINNSKRW